MADNVANIKERLDVVDVISGYIKLQKAGINYKGRCPFHNEKTPSFYVSPERQIWHCFGCQKGGDMFTFVQEMEGVEFPEALRTLATKAGVELEFTGAQEKKEDHSQLYEISELATRFFEKQLSLSKQGVKAHTYLKERGLTDATIREFRLGFAPNDWRGLSDFLRSKGYKDSDIVTAGVSLPGKEEGIYDRFRSRITFPIFDINDRVVGFTARIFSPDGPEPKDVGKYINTPQTPIYDKSKILYGLNKARSYTRQMGNCLLVEGNMDAIMAWQAGSKNVVATSGTALTVDHLKILKRYTINLDFCFDIDQAGLSATRRGVGMALSQNFNVRAIQTDDPESKDPADYIKKFGDKWLKIVSSPKPVLDFYFDNSRVNLNLNTVEGKKKILEVLAPFVKRLTSNIERSHWVARLAAILKTKEDVIEKDLVRVPDDLASYEVAPEKAWAKAPESKIEIGYDDPLGPALLAVIIRNPAIFADDIKQVNPQLFKPPITEIFQALKQENLSMLDFPSFCAKFEGQAALQLEFANLKASEFLEGFDAPLLKEEFGSIIKRTQKKNISAQLASLELEIKQAEEFGEAQRLPELLSQFSQLTNQLKELV